MRGETLRSTVAMGVDIHVGSLDVGHGVACFSVMVSVMALV